MILVCLIVAVPIIVWFYENKRKIEEYKESEYYQQTHNDYELATKNKGVSGEYKIWKNLERVNGYKRILLNCYLPKKDGTMTEVDAIMIHESGIYVIESKNYGGYIFGTEEQQFWTETLPGDFGTCQKYRFYNPLKQNDSHIRQLKKYLHYFSDFYYSFVVFSDDCDFKSISITSGNKYVMHRKDVIDRIEYNAKLWGTRLSNEEIDKYYQMLYPLTQFDQTTKNKHIVDVQAIKDNRSSTCPWCGGKLVTRTAKTGKNIGHSFLGGSNYPRCKFTKNLQ